MFGVVAPLVGAWIEMSTNEADVQGYNASLPSWERGLKLLLYVRQLYKLVSLPSWERGLK